MDAIIIVAIISAIVSILSLLGSIYVARQNRKSSEKIIGLQIFSSIQKERLEAFIGFEKHAELTRIRCWGLLGRVDSYISGEDEFSNDVYSEAVSKLVQQTENLAVAWAAIKAELPDEIEHYTRRLWHQSNSNLKVLIGFSQFLLSENTTSTSKLSQKKLSSPIRKKMLETFKPIAEMRPLLLGDLDELIRISKSIRHTIQAGYDL